MSSQIFDSPVLCLFCYPKPLSPCMTATPAQSHTAYEIAFTRSGRGALREFEQEERVQIRTKLAEIATCAFRQPREWDFQELPGRAEGRFRIGHDLRVFADIDEEAGVIRVHNVKRRENLYT